MSAISHIMIQTLKYPFSIIYPELDTSGPMIFKINAEVEISDLFMGIDASMVTRETAADMINISVPGILDIIRAESGGEVVHRHIYDKVLSYNIKFRGNRCYVTELVLQIFPECKSFNEVSAIQRDLITIGDETSTAIYARKDILIVKTNVPHSNATSSYIMSKYAKFLYDKKVYHPLIQSGNIMFTEIYRRVDLPGLPGELFYAGIAFAASCVDVASNDDIEAANIMLKSLSLEG